MPQLQIVNTEAAESPNRAEENLTTFFSKLGKDYQDKNDRVEIGKIINEYQQNREDANAWENLQLNLEKSNISPTKRLQTQQNLNDIRKGILERDKLLNTHAKDLEQKAKADALEKEKKDKEEALANENKQKAAKTALEVKEILLNSGEDPEEAERLSTILSPTSANQRAKERINKTNLQNKKLQEEEIERKDLERTQKAFNDIVELIPKAGRGTKLIGTFGGENAKTAGKFTSLTGALEAILVDKVSRGTLSNTRFKYITETLLPKVNDTQNEIKGKLEGLAVILDLDPSALQDFGKKNVKPEKQENVLNTPEGKVRVKVKGSNPPVFGSVTPYEGMEAKYELVK